jgi:hypothetical protein
MQTCSSTDGAVLAGAAACGAAAGAGAGPPHKDRLGVYDSHNMLNFLMMINSVCLILHLNYAVEHPAGPGSFAQGS